MIKFLKLRHKKANLAIFIHYLNKEKKTTYFLYSKNKKKKTQNIFVWAFH